MPMESCDGIWRVVDIFISYDDCDAYEVMWWDMEGCWHYHLIWWLWCIWSHVMGYGGLLGTINSCDDCECLWSHVMGYGGLLSIINSYEDCECLCSLVNGYGGLLSIINSYFLVPTHVIDYVQLFTIVKRYEWLWMIIGTCHWLWRIIKNCQPLLTTDRRIWWPRFFLIVKYYYGL